MFEYQVTSMRRTALRLSLRVRPPLSVYLKKRHAEYLGINYVKVVPQEVSERNPPPPGTKTTEPLVEVDFAEFFAKVQGAKGVEHNQDSGQGRKPTADKA